MPAILESQPALPSHELVIDEASFHDQFCSAMEEVETVSYQHGNVDVIKVTWLSSIVGPLLVGIHERGVRFVHFAQQERIDDQLMRLQRELGKPLRGTPHTLHEQLSLEMQDYCAGKRKTFSVPLKIHGTAFQQRVWQALQQIPYGETWNYEQLASAIGQPTASRAVGLANGANPIAILVPCHRVINKNGQLGGYGGGQWRKEKLLKLEQK